MRPDFFKFWARAHTHTCLHIDPFFLSFVILRCSSIFYQSIIASCCFYKI